MAKELTLGVLFKGDISPTLKNSVKQLNTLLKNLEGSLNNLSKNAKVSRSAMSGLGSEVSESGKRMGDATNESQKFQAALAQLGSGKTGTALKVLETNLRKVEKAIQLTAQRMNTADKAGDKFAQSANRVKLHAQVLASKLKIVNGEFVRVGSSSKKAAAGMATAGAASKSAWKEINTLNKAIDNGTKSWQEVSRQQAAFYKTTDKASKKIAEAQIATANFNKEKQALSKAIKSGNITLSEGAKRLQTLGGKYKDVVPAAKNLASATTSASKPFIFLGKQIASVNGAVDRLKAAFKVTASYGAASAAIYGLVTALRAGASAIVDYDQALKNLQAITGATDAQVAAMGSTIMDVARTTKFSTTEVAEGMVLLGQAGFDAGESMDAMQATANLATGTLSDMKATTDLLTTTIRAFNLDTIESGRVSDVMANAVNKSKLTIDKLRIAFNYVGATSAQAGLALEETAASAIVLANNGLRASTIGTGFRQVLARLLSPSSKLREAYEAHGIALDSVNPKTVGYQAALAQLSSVLYDSESQTVDTAKAFELFGLRGAQAAAILVKEYVSGKFNVAIDNVYNLGTSADMAGKQAEGLGVMLKNLADRAGLVAVKIGEAGVAGAFRVLIDSARGALDAVETFATSAIGKALIQITALTGALVGLRAGIGFIASAFGGWSIIKTITTNYHALTAAIALNNATMTGSIGILGKVKAAFIALWMVVKTHPFAAIVAAVSAVIVIIGQLASRNKELADSLKREAVEAKRLADGIDAYATSLANADRNTDEYNNRLKRFEEAFPKVAKEIRTMTGSVDLADLSTEKLIETMNELAGLRAAEALQKTTDALKRYTKEVKQNEESVRRLKDGTRGWFEVWQGDPLEKLSESQKTLRDTQDQHIQILKTLVEVGKETVEGALERINTMGLEEEQLEKVTRSFETHFTKIKLGSRDATNTYKHAFTELPEHFDQIYRSLNSLQQAHLIETVSKMNNEVAAYKKRAADMGVVESEMHAHIEAIRQKAYDDFEQGLNKETTSLDKELEKRKKSHQKLADSIKGIENKILEDLKRLRQNNMTDEAKYYDDRKEARRKLAEAIKAVAEAQTQDEIKAAGKMLSDVSASYTAMADSAKAAFKKNSYEAERSGKEIISGFDKITESFKTLKSKVEDPPNTTPTVQAINDVGDASENAKEETADFSDSIKESSKAMDENKESADRLKDALNDISDSTKKAAKETSGWNDLLDSNLTITTNSEYVIKRLRGEIDAYGNSAKKAADATTKATTTKNAYRTAVDDSRKSIESLTFSLDAYNERQREAKYLEEQRILQWYEGYYAHSSNENPYRSPDPVEKPLPPSLRATGGKIPGYGGGDTVPAMLEKGEFVIRKEAVRKYGQGMFESFNNMAQKMSVGGLAIPKIQVPAFAQGGMVPSSNQMSGQLHTINLNVNNTPHKLYGDTDAVNGLVKTLRRTQLVTA